MEKKMVTVLLVLVIILAVIVAVLAKKLHDEHTRVLMLGYLMAKQAERHALVSECLARSK
jgi:hypothetical protein